MWRMTYPIRQGLVTGSLRVEFKQCATNHNLSSSPIHHRHLAVGCLASSQCREAAFGCISLARFSHVFLRSSFTGAFRRASVLSTPVARLRAALPGVDGLTV